MHRLLVEYCYRLKTSCQALSIRAIDGGSLRKDRSPMLNLPRFKAAAVQAAPAFLDPVATVDKAASLIREAAANGAALVAFPEVFVAGYPYWSWIVDPVAGSAWF